MLPTCDRVIRGDLVLADGIVEDGSLGVIGGKIAVIRGTGDSTPPTRKVSDYAGRYVMPGVVDTHVHAGSFLTESIRTTTAAAAAGGVTTIVDMPYDRSEPVMGRPRFDAKVREVEAAAIVDVGLYGTIEKTGGLGAIEELVDAGACAFKFSLYEYDARRFPRIDDGELVAAFEMLSAPAVPIVLHTELQEIVERLLRNALESTEENDPYAHGRTHPPVSETAATAKALEFARATGARLHVAHCTLPDTFDLIDYFAGRGARVSGETCVHYLVLSEGDVARLGSIAKVNPPIRDEDAREGLWRALRAGRIATVSTDHAAWPLETKEQPILRASAGAPGLETFLPLMVTEARRRAVPLPQVLRLVTLRPAEIFGLADRKGQLHEGLDADLAVFDARQPWTFSSAASVTNAKWSPFDGRELAGRVEATFVRGEVVYDGTSVVGEPGYGRWLRRTAARQ
jgi:allantoinase